MKKLMRGLVVELFCVAIAFVACSAPIPNKSEETEVVLDSEMGLWVGCFSYLLEENNPDFIYSVVEEDTTNKVAASYENETVEEENEEFIPKWKIGYSNQRINVREEPDAKSERLDILKVNTKLSYIEYDDAWAQIKYGKTVAYVSIDHISDKKVKENYVYSGTKLTKKRGVVIGPSGKETYYTQNISNIIARMRRKGYDRKTYPYWVRDDGVKMLGDYVIVACDFSIRPIGTILKTSVGIGIVCDTGNFNNTGSRLVDVATNWGED